MRLRALNDTHTKKKEGRRSNHLILIARHEKKNNNNGGTSFREAEIVTADVNCIA